MKIETFIKCLGEGDSFTVEVTRTGGLVFELRIGSFLFAGYADTLEELLEDAKNRYEKYRFLSRTQPTG